MSPRLTALLALVLYGGGPAAAVPLLTPADGPPGFGPEVADRTRIELAAVFPRCVVPGPQAADWLNLGADVNLVFDAEAPHRLHRRPGPAGHRHRALLGRRRPHAAQPAEPRVQRPVPHLGAWVAAGWLRRSSRALDQSPRRDRWKSRLPVLHEVEP